MTGRSCCCIQKVDVGTPSPGYLSRCVQKEWDVVDVCFHGFQNLPAARGDYAESPEFTCVGHQWTLRLFPGGVNALNHGEVALFLDHQSHESISLQIGFSVKDKDRISSIDFMSQGIKEFQSVERRQRGWGCPSFATRTVLISALVEGSLIIEVRMRQPDTPGSILVPFVADNPLSKNILGMFNDEGSADVLFEVGGGVEPTVENKRAKISPTTLYAHRLILEACAPELFTPGKSGESLTTIPIPDIKPDIFRHLLYYTYGGKVAEDDLKSHAKDIIKAADKYGVVGLKLEAEATLVTSTIITIDNLSELLHFAVDTHCALLKEAAMDFVVKNKAEVVQKVSFDDFGGDLVKDVLMADIMNDSVRVGSLRKQLHEKGLDIDGSREMLVARLKENS